MPKSFLILFFLLLCSRASIAQSISGDIKDKADNSPLIGANLILSNASDSTKKYYAVTNIKGSFEFEQVSQGATF